MNRDSCLPDEPLQNQLITLFRGLAALQVFYGHARNQFFPDYKDVVNPSLVFKGIVASTKFGYMGVMVFFVISGWLVGGNFLDRYKKPNAFKIYAVDRFTRLYTVLVPALLLTYLVGAWVLSMGSVAREFVPPDSITWAAALGNLAALQELYVPNFGGNFSLWSLPLETWYYVLFPLLIVAFTAQKKPTRILTLILIVALAIFVKGRVVGYFSIWLLGVLGSRLEISYQRAFFWMCLTAFLLLVLIGRFYSLDEHFPFDFLVGLAFTMVLVSAKVDTKPFPRGLRKISTFLSDFSFSLYVVHMPLIILACGLLMWTGQGRRLDPHTPKSYFIFAAILLSIFVLARVFYELFEAQTLKVRSFVKKRVGLAW